MAKKLWGERFSKKTDPLVEEFTTSIHYDYKLAKYDIYGSIAHAHILRKAGFLTAKEASKLIKGLRSILNTIRNHPFKFNPNDEDIHTNIQNILEAEVGDLALKLHTARSRNDQVAFSTKLYCKENIKKIQKGIGDLVFSFKALSRKYTNLVIPGFTH
ncbi:MAG: lyase family protein, partial [Candidatus Omnitrophica bacterium]|nr:lyase family protein [Candidatus Omnitrophota bacterium]